MKKTALLFFVLFAAKNNFAQTVAATRCANFGIGQNISNWLERGFDSDWPQPNKYAKSDLQKMKDAGIKSLRLPACFERVSDTVAPYFVDTNHVLFSYIDSVISWADELNMNVTIDNHHLWDSITNTAWRGQEQRFSHLWAVLAQRYAHLDPERYTFELWNEPNLAFSLDSMNILFNETIDSIRQFAPNHTIIVSPNISSSGMAFTASYTPLPDTNLIYAWHFYDPLDFTHQGFSWGNFPTTVAVFPDPSDFFYGMMNSSLENVKTWKAAHPDKPVVLGEFGVGVYANDTSRCNWITMIGEYIDTNHIPAFYWDWAIDFNMFKSGVIAEDSILPCFGEALHYYGMEQSSGIPKTMAKNIEMYPNPIASGAAELHIEGVRNFDFRVFDNTGRLVAKGANQNQAVRLHLNTGLYFIQVFSNAATATKKLVVE